MWEWHALIVWAALAAITVPALAAVLTPLLRRLLRRVQRGGVPTLGDFEASRQ